MVSEEQNELILREDEKRLSLFPIKYPDIWKLYKNAESQSWIAQEIDFSDDRFDELSKEEQEYLKMLMAFFSESDNVVNENLTLNFMSQVKISEINCFYGFQTYNEQVHAETYSLAIQEYIKDPDEKNRLFYAIKNIPTVAKKTQWAIDWISKGTFQEKLVAFALVESVFFQSTFAGVFYFRDSNKVNGFCSANEFIMRDETSHYSFATYIYNNYIQNKLTEERLREMVLSCVDTELQFIEDSMPKGLLGLSKEKMIQYVQYVADTVLMNFNCKTVFNVTQPLDYMEKLSIPRKTNFFEKRVTEYTKLEDSKMTIDMDMDF